MTESTRDIQNSRDHAHIHVPVQHRDGMVPWCNKCGLDDHGREPTPRKPHVKSEEEILTVADTNDSPIMRYFELENLPGRVANISRPFYDLAMLLEKALPRGVEKNVTLRKLLESKDAAIRAALFPPEGH